MPVVSEDVLQANRGRNCDSTVKECVYSQIEAVDATVLPEDTLEMTYVWMERKTMLESDSVNQQKFLPSDTR